jgi:hypothetical protein
MIERIARDYLAIWCATRRAIVRVASFGDKAADLRAARRTRNVKGRSRTHRQRPAGAGAPAQFSVPVAASLGERRPLTLRYGDSFALFDHNGDALSGPGTRMALFHRDTRYLSRLYLTVDGERPLLPSSTLRDDNP